MSVYYVLLIFIGVLGFLGIGIRDKKLRAKVITICGCLAIIFVQGVRHISVGTDLLSYIPALRYSENLNFLKGDTLYNYEIGYCLFIQLLAKLNVSDQMFLTIISAIVIIPIGFIWMKYSKNIAFSIFIYITLGFFTFTFSGLRQSIALALAFYSYKFIVDRKLGKFILIILGAILFHETAIIFLIAYPLYTIKIKPKHFIVIVPTLLCVFILKAPIYKVIYYIYRGEVGEVELTNAYTMLLVMTGVYLFSYLLGNNNDEKFSSYQNYMLVAILIQIFASQSSSIMRLGYYFYIFITLLIPAVIKNQKDIKIRLLGSGVVIMAMLVFYHLTTSGGYLNVVPFRFFWN